MNKITKLAICGALAIAGAISMWRYRWVLVDSTNVTRNPVNAATLMSYAQTGLSFKKLQPQWSPIGEFSELRAIHATDTSMKLFEGKFPRNVQLYSVSKMTGAESGVSYQYVNPSLTKGDPHFAKTHNHWQDIPCYLITFQSRVSLTSGGPATGPGTHAQPRHPRPSNVITVVDAANGMVLLSFAMT